MDQVSSATATDLAVLAGLALSKCERLATDPARLLSYLLTTAHSHHSKSQTAH